MAASSSAARTTNSVKSGATTIGALGKAAHVNIETIRYYERIGLMPPPARSRSGYRTYDEHHVERLEFIRHSRELGFSLDAIRELLALSDKPDRSCAEADSIARVHLRDVEARIASLEALRSELTRMIRNCSHDRIADCRVIRVLADHAQCAIHGREAAIEQTAARKPRKTRRR
jgi:Cu(I)-responsive transcriptional regulator